MTPIQFIKEVYAPKVITRDRDTLDSISTLHGLAPTKPQKVAGILRTILSILGTLVTLFGTLEISGVPVSEWVATIAPIICE